jgi:hypothetical protein
LAYKALGETEKAEADFARVDEERYRPQLRETDKYQKIFAWWQYV